MCGCWCWLCHAEHPFSPSSHPSLRVYIQNVPVWRGTTLACVTTCGRGAGTHGGVLNLHTEVFETDTRERGVTVSSANHETGPRRVITCFKEVHRKKPLVLTHSRFENRSRTTRSRFLQSFALPDEAVELHFILRDTTHNTPLLKHTTTQHTPQERLRVCRHHAHMCFNMCVWCRHTQGRFERTPGGFQRATPHRTDTPRPQRHAQHNTTRQQHTNITWRQGQRQDKTRQDKTRQDKTRQDKTRQDKTRQRQDKTRQDKTRQDKTRQDKTRQDKTRQDKTKTRQDKTRQDKTRQDKTRQDKTRQDKTRQDKTRQDKTRQDRQDKTRQDKTKQNKTKQNRREKGQKGK